MLSPESRLTEGEGVLVLGSHMGLGRHFVAALARLEERVLGHLSERLSKTLLEPLSMELLQSPGDFPDLPILQKVKDRFRSVVLIPSEELSAGRALVTEKVAAIHAFLLNLKKLGPSSKIIVVLPEKQPEADIMLLAEESTTIFLVSAIPAFRDEGLFDETLTALKENQYPEITSSLRDENISLAMAPDVCGLLVGALRRDPPYKGVLRVRPNLSNAQLFVKLFRENFTAPDEENGFFLGFKKIFRRTEVGQGLAEAQLLNKGLEPSMKHPFADEVFPVSPTAPLRILKQSIEIWRRDEKIDLHFPPSRAL